MKRFVAIALLFVSLCAIGCSGDKQSTTVKQDKTASSTSIKAPSNP